MVAVTCLPPRARPSPRCGRESPLTPPPRRAPAPQTSTLSSASRRPTSPPRTPPRRTATPGRGGRCSRRAAPARPRARPACAPPGTARRRAPCTGSPRSARPARCSATRSVDSIASALASCVVAGEQPRGHVQPEARQRLRPRLAQLGPEDRGIGQRVAVDLARRQLGHLPALRLRVGDRELRRGLVDVERPRERLARVDRRRRAAAAAASSSMLSLSCAPSGAGSSGAGSPSSRASTAGAALASTWRAATAPPSKRTSAPTPSVSIDGHLDAQAQLRARRPRDRRRAPR